MNMNEILYNRIIVYSLYVSIIVRKKYHKHKTNNQRYMTVHPHHTTRVFDVLLLIVMTQLHFKDLY